MPAVKKTVGGELLRRGAIVKITLHNFLTFDDAVITPGARLNFILGPNGTGKSSIVCAICLGLAGSTNSIMRAEKLGDYVKRGKRSGYVIVELHRAPGSTYVVKRTLDIQHNSQFFLDGKKVPNREIEQLCVTLNIQVNNLTVFLAQDRVSSFARLTPSQLLLETQKAVSSEMFEKHTELIQLKKTLDQSEKEMNENQARLELILHQRADIQNELDRYNEQKINRDKVKWLKKKVPWAVYFEATLERDAQKNEVLEQRAVVQQAEEQLGPLQAKLETADEELARAKSQADKAKQTFSAQEMKRVHLSKKLEALGEEAIDAKAQLERVDSDFAEKKLRVKKFHKIIEKMNANIEVMPTMEDTDAEIKKIKVEQANSNKQQKVIKRELADVKEALDDNKGEVRELQNKLKKLSNYKTQVVHKLGNRQVSMLMQFLEKNRSKLRGEVFGPMIAEIKVHNNADADMIEQAINNRMKQSFVFTSKQDMHNAKSFCNSKNVQIPLYTLDGINNGRAVFSGKVSRQLKADGMRCFMDELYNAPAPVKQILNDFSKLDRIAVVDSFDDVSKIIATSQSDGRPHWVYTPETSHMCKFSKYRASDTAVSIANLGKARYLASSGDFAQATDIKVRVEKLNEEAEELLQKQAGLKEQINELRRADKSETLNDLHSQKKKLKSYFKVLKNTERNLALEEENDEDLEQQKEKVRADLAKIHKMRVGHFQKVVQILNSWPTIVKDRTDAVLKHLIQAGCVDQFRAAFELDKSLLTDQRGKLAHVEAAFVETVASVKKKKAHAKRTSPKTPEIVAKFQEEWMPNKVDKIEQLIAELEAKANAAIHDQTIFARAKKLDQEIKGLENIVESSDSAVEQRLEMVKALEKSWLPKLRDCVDEINVQFTTFFSRMGCKGKVELIESDDFEAFKLEIHTQFRKPEADYGEIEIKSKSARAGGMKLLSSFAQSGGERSVATMLYLLSLQNVTECPFRVVDEINQGMDPANERMIFEQIVRSSEANKERCCQYFLLTPKLLPRLNYSESITILCIFNGPWNMTADKWDIKKFIANLRKRKNSPVQHQRRGNKRALR